MFKRHLLTPILLCLSVAANASQDMLMLKATVANLSSQYVYLLEIQGSRQTLLDSARVSEAGEFRFVSPNGRRYHGMFRVILDSDGKGLSSSFPFIYNGDGTAIRTDSRNPVDSMVVISGEENKRYYAYLERKTYYKQRIDKLGNMLSSYPNDCASGKWPNCFYAEIQKEYNRLQVERRQLATEAQKKYPYSLLTSIISAEQPPFLDGFKTKQEQLDELKEQFFKPSDFQDTLLLHTDVLTNKVLQFLSFYRNPQLSEEQQSAKFIKALDVLQPIARAGKPAVYSYLVSFLVQGFNEIKQDTVVAYIREHYLAGNSCDVEDAKLKEALQKSADYKRTAIGAVAPDIKFVSSFTEHSLADISDEFTLVVFWASWCPHCSAFLPALQKLYNKYKGGKLAVVAVSLDTDPKEWEGFLKKGNYDWINVSDFKKWDGEVPRAYNVVATPTLFLLDKDKRIIDKPVSVAEIESRLILK